MQNLTPGKCGTEPCATNNCSPAGLTSPLCHPDLAILPQVDRFRIIGVLGQCLVTMKCDFDGFLVSDGSGFYVTKQPCVQLPRAITVKYDDNGNVVTDESGNPVEGDPPSMAGIIAVNQSGCQFVYRGASGVRQKLVSLDGEISFVDDPDQEDSGDYFCSEVKCDVRIIPEGTIYTVQLNSTAGFVVGEAVRIDSKMYEVIEIVSENSLAIRPYLPVEESYTIANGSTACFATYAPKCSNTPEYDIDTDGRITAIKVCTENSGDRILKAAIDKIIAGYEEDDQTFWRLKDAAPSVTGLSFYPVYPRKFMLFSDNKQRETLLNSSVTFAVPDSQVPANTGRDLYMVLNIYSVIGCSVLRLHTLKMWEDDSMSDDKLVHQHTHTNSSSNTSTNAESSMVIIKVPWSTPKMLALWFKWTGAIQSNPHQGSSYVQLVGYYA